jgi:hypothetical protein
MQAALPRLARLIFDSRAKRLHQQKVPSPWLVISEDAISALHVQANAA